VGGGKTVANAQEIGGGGGRKKSEQIEWDDALVECPKNSKPYQKEKPPKPTKPTDKRVRGTRKREIQTFRKTVENKGGSKVLKGRKKKRDRGEKKRRKTRDARNFLSKGNRCTRKTRKTNGKFPGKKRPKRRLSKTVQLETSRGKSINQT